VLLSNHPLFREFGPAVIEMIASHMTRRTVERGTAIFSRAMPEWDFSASSMAR
jgi:hypothetical protein